MNNQLYIDVHTHASSAALSDTFRVINLFAGEMPDGIEAYTKFSIGLHPWQIDTGSREQKLLEVEHALQNPMVIAVGETGLDKVIKVPMDLQKEVFRRHVVLAEKFGKPVIIHSVRSHFEVIEVYKNSGATIPLIFHGFTGSHQTAKQLLKHNIYFSFGKDLVTDRQKVIEAFTKLPVERLFLETDDSDFSIDVIYEKAAFLKQMSVENFKKQMYQNFQQVFKII